jgi:hypothetical protein
MKQLSILWVTFSILAIAACQRAPKDATPAFYHWKSELTASAEASSFLEAAGTERIYLRFFDLDWNERLRSPAPIAVLQADSYPYPQYDCVPTLFITNRSLKQLPIQETVPLARRIVDKIMSMADDLGIKQIHEVQLDCDWTESTQPIYFRLLRECRDLLAEQGVQLSTTIRLHQLRYPDKTGVPPVDRGMLMYYNMGEVRQWEENNSILNLKAAEPYLIDADYPLPLDLALPLFRWGVVFREDKMIRLINNLSAEALQDRTRFFRMTQNRYEVQKGTFLQGHYLYKGDFIRLEAVEPDDLEIAVQQLKAIDWPRRFHLAFYHLDSTIVNNYAPKLLQSLEEKLEE